MNKPLNVHACAVLLDTKGVLIRGSSGSGKTRLAQLLINNWLENQRYASWVGDDRVELIQQNGTTLARSPQVIAGLKEQRFLGILAVDQVDAAVIDLIVDMEPLDQLERMPPKRNAKLIEDGHPIAQLSVPVENPALALELVEATLKNFV